MYRGVKAIITNLEQMKMKKFNLFILAFIISATTFAQSYNVSLCGTVTNGTGATADLSIDYWGPSNQGSATVTTDTTGNWCITFIAYIDSGTTSSLLDYILISQTNCTQTGAGDTLPNLVITQDTGFYSIFDNCNDTTVTSCSVLIYDSVNNATLYAIPSGQAPFYYLWSNGSGSDSLWNPTPNTVYCVTIVDAISCSSTVCYTTGAGLSCSVAATVYTDTLDLATFTASATGISPFTYVWDFGDGNTATGATVTNQYITNGSTTFTWCVAMTDSLGCTSTDCQTITFGEINSPACEVLMSYSVDSVNTSTIYLTSYPTGVAPFSYAWYFSDGGTSTSANPVYTFTQGAGYDWACVEVTDTNGCVASYCDYIQISPPPVACYASFYAEFFDINGTVGEVFFTDVSTSGAAITSWDWDLGNGQTSTLQNPSSIYTIAGYYTVCLTMTDVNGCTSTFCQTCYIDPTWWLNSPWNTSTNGCSSDFIALQDTSLPGMIYLVDLAIGNTLHYSWDFGNGVVINNQFPAVTFTDFGTYNICLTITDTIAGCTDTYCDTITIDSLGNLNKLGNWGISVIPTPMPKRSRILSTTPLKTGRNFQVNSTILSIRSPWNLPTSLKQSEISLE